MRSYFGGRPHNGSVLSLSLRFRGRFRNVTGLFSFQENSKMEIELAFKTSKLSNELMKVMKIMKLCERTTASFKQQFSLRGRLRVDLAFGLINYHLCHRNLEFII